MAQNDENMNLDTHMLMFYRALAKIEPDECIAIPEKVDGLEIRLDEGLVSVEDFFKSGIKTVALDDFSSKKMNDEILRSIPDLSETARQHFSRFYVHASRIWGIIEYHDKTVGIANRVQVYNGLPKLVDTDEYLKNPNGTIRRVADLMTDPSQLNANPVIVNRREIKLHKDFLAQHPIRKVTKSWYTKATEYLYGPRN